MQSMSTYWSTYANLKSKAEELNREELVNYGELLNIRKIQGF
jgi:hypothetical protein